MLHIEFNWPLITWASSARSKFPASAVPSNTVPGYPEIFEIDTATEPPPPQII
jgi:hypothetical protein